MMAPVFFKCSRCERLLAVVTHVKNEGVLVRVRKRRGAKEAWRQDLTTAIKFMRSYLNDTCPFCGKTLYEEPRLAFSLLSPGIGGGGGSGRGVQGS